MQRSPVASADFEGMGVTVTVAGVGVAATDVAAGTRQIQRLAIEWEQRFSRFLPQSELQRVNDAGGKPVPVSQDFIELLEQSIEGVRRTAGRFDPAVLDVMEWTGYDRSFAKIDDFSPIRHNHRWPGPRGPWAGEVVIDHPHRTVRIPRGVRLDFGGIAKGAFVDRAVELLMDWPGGYVDAGGDLRVWGTPPSGLFWTAGIQDPRRDDADLATALLLGRTSQAMATSGTYRRRWTRGGAVMHHLIDPATGLPLPDVVFSVTVFAGSVSEAEIESKSLIVAAARGEPLDLFSGEMAFVCYQDGTHVVVKSPGQSSVEILSGRRATATA